jgi:hypothetical protein
LILVDRAVWPWRGRRWAHLVSDDTYDELHRFAQAIGKRRLSFQGDHYDVDEASRALALDAGALAVDSRELVRRMRAAGLRRRDPWRLVDRGRIPHGDVGPRLERLGLTPPMTGAAVGVAAGMGGVLEVTVLQRVSEVGVGLLGDRGTAPPAPSQPPAGLEVHVWEDDGRPLVELVMPFLRL